MVHISPVGLAAAPVANRLSFLAVYKERLCHSVCSTSSTQPQASVSYRNETPILNDTTVFIPIVATVTIVTPACGCKAESQVITERFMIAFQDQTALPTNVTITQEGQTQGLIKIICGKSNCYAINDSLAVAITPPAAAAA